VSLGIKALVSESRFAAYVEAIASALAHAGRAAPFQSCRAGLLLPGDRKTVEPMAARVQPARVQAAQGSLHHFVATADWSDTNVLAAVRTRPARHQAARPGPRADHRRHQHAEEKQAFRWRASAAL
jgi:SRSO17 transposase